MERRREERVRTGIDAACRIPARPIGGKVHDASRGGLRIELKGYPAEVGSTAIIELPALAPIAGQVVWSLGNQAGIRLARPLVGDVAVALGIEAPAPPPQAPAMVEDEAGPCKPLQHWLSRLLRRPFRT